MKKESKRYVRHVVQEKSKERPQNMERGCDREVKENKYEVYEKELQQKNEKFGKNCYMYIREA